MQPNSSITQQTDSGYDDDNQPLESTLVHPDLMVRDISLHGGLKTDKIHPLAGHPDPEPNVNVHVWEPVAS